MSKVTEDMLSELPEPINMGFYTDSTMRAQTIKGYTREQMRDYAHTALEAALPQQGEIVVTRNESSAIVAVTRNVFDKNDPDMSEIVEIIAEADVSQGEAVAFAYTRATTVVDPLPVITPVEYALLRKQGHGENFRALVFSDSARPAPQSEPISDELAEALAVGDGTMEGALRYWHQRALAAEAAKSEPAGSALEAAAIALWHRFGDESVMEWEDESHKAHYRLAAQAVAEALAATGEQSGSERDRFEAWAETILGDNPNWRESGNGELARQAWQAATTSRDTVGEILGYRIDWPDEPDLGFYFSEGPNLGARSVPLYAAPPAQGVDLGKLQRYEFSQYGENSFYMDPVDDGEYVLLADVQKLIDQRDGGVKP